jgi:ribose transport system permease protein
MMLLIIAFFSIVVPSFFSLSNATNIIRQGTVLALAAFGQTFVILVAGIDLSIGAIMGLTSSTLALLMLQGYPVVTAVLLALLVALACGAINGLLANYIGLDPFVATFGMQSMALGVALTITQERTIFGFSGDLRFLMNGKVLGVPVPLLIVVAIWIVLHFVLTRTAWGMSIYAIGGNEEAARLSGIPVKFRKTLLYCISGLLAGCAGVLFLARSNSASAIDPIGYEFDSICVVVLGGTAMAGGIGGVKNTLIGVALLATLRNGMNMWGVNLYLQLVLVGVILIFALIAERRQAASRAKALSQTVPGRGNE